MFNSLPVQNYLIFAAFVVLLQFIKKRWVWESLILSVFGTYLCLSVFSEQTDLTVSTQAPIGFYNQLASNLIKGKLYVPNEPTEILKKLPNPYLPSAHYGKSFEWDHSYYNGHFYLYWGIAPIITLLIPFHMLTGAYLAERMQGLWFALLAFLFAYLLITELVKKHTGDRPDRLSSFLIAGALVFCTEFGGVVRRNNIYETAIFACAAFLFAGYYVLAQQSKTKRRDIIAGVLFGLALASRPTAICGALVLPGLIRDWRTLLRVGYGFFPVAVLIGVYNYLRFDNPFEFGFRYQMCSLDMSKWGFKTANVLYATGAYIFQPVISRPFFPFLSRAVFGEGWLVLRHEYMNESIVGLVSLCPMVIFTIPALNRSIELKKHRIIYTFLMAGFASLVINSIAGVAQRYSAEFMLYFVAATLTAIFVTTLQVRNWLWRFAVVCLLLYSMNAGFFISFTPIPSQFASLSPRSYAALVEFYKSNKDVVPEPISKFRSPPAYPPEVLITGDRCGLQPKPPIRPH